MRLMAELRFKRVGFIAIESDLDWLQLQKLLKVSAEKEGLHSTTSRMRANELKDEITDLLIDTARAALEPMLGKTMGKFSGVGSIQ